MVQGGVDMQVPATQEEGEGMFWSRKYEKSRWVLHAGSRVTDEVEEEVEGGAEGGWDKDDEEEEEEEEEEDEDEDENEDEDEEEEQDWEEEWGEGWVDEGLHRWLIGQKIIKR